MSLGKTPTRTPGLLAANRANARKYTGPRTSEGKSRVALNALPRSVDKGIGTNVLGLGIARGLALSTHPGIRAGRWPYRTYLLSDGSGPCATALHSQDFVAALVRSTRNAKEFRGIYRALDVALLPDKTGAARLLRRGTGVGDETGS